MCVVTKGQGKWSAYSSLCNKKGLQLILDPQLSDPRLSEIENDCSIRVFQQSSI